MTIAPVVVFVVAVALAIGFEGFYAFLDRKLYLSVEKGLWTLVYWVAIGILGSMCGMLPEGPSLSGMSLVLFFVACVHVCVNLFHGDAIKFRPSSRSDTTGAGMAKTTGVTAPTSSEMGGADEDDEASVVREE